MESNKYNIDNFERFLRAKTDEFRMYPSKRVWYSIYNNMHPGNRLPSVSMSIVLIGFLFLIGYLHTDVSKETSSHKDIIAKTEQVAVAADKNLPSNTSTINAAIAGNITRQNQYAGLNVTNISSQKTLMNAYRQTAKTPTGYTLNKIIHNESTASANKLSTSTTDVASNLSTANDEENTNDAGDDNTIASLSSKDLLAIEASIVKPQDIAIAKESGSENAIVLSNSNTSSMPVLLAALSTEENSKEAKPDAPIAKTKGNTLSLADKAWIEDYALHNRPVRKWAGKVGVQVYFTASVVYRKLHNNAVGKSLNGNPNTAYNNFNVDNAVTHKPSFGLEAGVSLQYDITRRIKIKGGLQANYTRYNAHAFETNHPIASSITMNTTDDTQTYEAAKMSNYSNNYGISSAKLHNETYQLSIPIGADYKVASLNNISWHAGATIQPTVLVYGKSYVISSDRRSYIQDKSLLNRFNLNAGFETYLSYKKCGYTLQLGPQYRTQIFSTNTKVYSVEERLQNFGFKVGITKKL